MSGDSRRVALRVSYDGTNYSGWQRQENADSVQARIEKALHALTGQEIGVTGASRTDAGVHALGQTVHFDNPSHIPADRFCYALNTCLPDDIRVTASCAAAGDFHARFNARGKTYRYLIDNSRHGTAMYRHFMAHIPQPLDAALMDAAAKDLLGEHDFAAFAAAGSVAKTTVREIWRADVQRNGDAIELTVAGKSFLYNMVRIIAGTLIYIGMGKLPPESLKKALETKDRLDLGITAPARGLTLMEVYYDCHLW